MTSAWNEAWLTELASPGTPLNGKTPLDAETRALILEPLGLADSQLPSYDLAPEGACVTCYRPPLVPGRTRCAYCIALSEISRPAARRPQRPQVTAMATAAAKTFLGLVLTAATVLAFLLLVQAALWLITVTL